MLEFCRVENDLKGNKRKVILRVMPQPSWFSLAAEIEVHQIRPAGVPEA